MIKKGFTLVELLAVFVVISIISMITIPKVFNWISKGESGALQVSTRQIYKAGDEYRLTELRNRDEKCVYFSFNDNYETETLVNDKMYIPIKELDLNGELPTEGEMEVCKDYVTIQASDGDSTVTIDPDGNDKVLDGSLEDNNISRPVIDDLDVLAKNTEIDVNVTAHDDKNDIVKYYYYLNGKLKHSGEETSFTFDDLTPGNSYKIKVEVENSLGFKASKTVTTTTLVGIKEPVITIDEDDWVSNIKGKVVTITYPEGKGYKYEYQVTEGEVKEEIEKNTWLSASQGQTVTFTTNGSVMAKVSDEEGNEKEVSYSVTKIDSTKPEVLLAGTPLGTDGVTLTATCSDDETDIKEILFSTDGDSWDSNGTEKVKEYHNQTKGSHTYHVKCVNNVGMENTATKDVTVSGLGEIETSIEQKDTWYQGWSNNTEGKTVTITYPSEGTHTFKVTSGTFTVVSGGVEPVGTENNKDYTVTGNTVKLKFTTNGSVTAKATDGINTVSKTQTVENIDVTKPTAKGGTEGLSGSTTTSSVTLTATCEDTETGIKEIEFSTNGSSWDSNGTEETKIYDNQEAGSHTYYVRCTNNVNMKEEFHKDFTITSLGDINISIEEGGWKTDKDVTITYPTEGTHSFNVSEGTFTVVEGSVSPQGTENSKDYTVTGDTVKLNFTTNGSVTAKVTDGPNSKTKDGSVSQVDNTTPVVTLKPTVQNGSNGWVYSASIEGSSSKPGGSNVTLYKCTSTSGECDPFGGSSVEGLKDTTTLSNNASAQTVCYQSQNEVGTKSVKQCSEAYKVDGGTPTVTPKDEEVTIEVGDSNLVSSYFDIKWGISGEGSITCTPETTTELEEGEQTVKCKATGKNGKESIEASKNITVVESGREPIKEDDETKYVEYTPANPNWSRKTDRITNEAPRNPGDFGGVEEGSSKNNSVTCYSSESFGNGDYSGYRIMDIDEDGVITLIHAGTPECYFHGVEALNSSNILRYNSTKNDLGASRAFTKYGNDYVSSVHYMDSNDYNIMMKNENDNEESYIWDYIEKNSNGTCYDTTKPECGVNNEFVDINRYYYIASTYSTSNLYIWNAERTLVYNGTGSYGVRPVIKLKKGVKIGEGNGSKEEPYELVIPKLKSITVTPSSLNMVVNEETTLNALPNPLAAAYEFEYTSNGDEVEVDSNGKVLAKKVGSTTITVKDTLTDVTVDVEVTVTNDVKEPNLEELYGKYVEYEPDEPTWESSKLTSYGVAETTQSSQGKFDIYDKTTNASAKGKAKSQSITCYNSSYANKYNGWRVLDVSGGVITLIHAGTPECYSHAYSSSGNSEASVKILETASTSSSPGDSKAWTKYGNATYAQSVHYMTNEDFNKITYQINKNNNYTITDNGSSNSTCYGSTNADKCGRDNDMIDIGSYYWLASVYDTSTLYGWAANSRYVYSNNDLSFGVRPVVVLNEGVKVGTSGTGTEDDPYKLVLPKATEIDVKPITVAVNEEKNVEITITPELTKTKLEYSTKDATTATVTTDGIVTGRQKGKTNLTVTDKISGISKTVTINVINAKEPNLETDFGKYVNYEPDDATWDSSKLSSYGVSETEDKTQGKFNIYDKTTNASAKGKTKSQSITCLISYANKYNGWRVLDVLESGQITLIHAGTPECYYHGTSSSVSVAILETASTSSSPGDSKAWTKYGNATFAQSVHYMTNEDYNKITYQINKNSDYTITDNGESNSTCYYSQNTGTMCGQDNDMIDIGSFYWLASASSDSILYYWNSYSRNVNDTQGSSYGVRPVVVLKDGVTLGSGSGTSDDPYKLAYGLTESISVSPATVSLFVGESQNLTVTPIPIGAKPQLEFESQSDGIATVDSSGRITGKKDGNTVITVTDKISNKQVSVEVRVSSVDRLPTNSRDIGKYVNYVPDDATWEEGKLESYGVSETEDKTQGKFNIYDKGTSVSAKGKSKSQSITCHISSYVNKYNGWRVLDVSSSGVITLIHAGTPECYYHSIGNSEASVKILETASTSSSPGDSKAWTKYGNATYATSVHYMTNEDYNRITYQINKNNNYTITDNGENSSTCYDKSESTQCGYNHNMIDIGTYYWIASAYNTNGLYSWTGSGPRMVSGNTASLGVRPVVVLKNGVRLENGKGTADDPYELTYNENLEGLTVSPSKFILAINEERKLNVTPYPSVASMDLEYTANDDKVSVSNDGIVTGVKKGKTSVTVKEKNLNKEVTVEIEVEDPITPTLETEYGKYVNYVPDEATWDSSKLSSYGVYETEYKYQGYFNIYDVGTSASAKGKEKSQSITCNDSSYPNKYNGWRILDISRSDQITLIHAGTPECYYHASGYSSASMLETSSTKDSPGASKAWTKYGNSTYATSVHYMTNEDYNKITYQINKNNNYTIEDNGSSISSCYQKSTTQCGYDNDMIEIGSYYWLASSILYNWDADPSNRYVNDTYNVSLGVRPVVVLKSGLKLSPNNKGTADDPYELVQTNSESISASPNLVSLLVGEKESIKVIPSPIASKVDLEYTSQQSSIANVDTNGEVTGVDAGETTITIKDKLTNKQVVVEVRVSSTERMPRDKDFGAFVNYEPDDPTWDSTKVGTGDGKYDVYESTQSNSQGKFDIYDVGTSRSAKGKEKSQSITCYYSSYKNKYNGWRVMDVSESGQITLIHAGTPECYNHLYTGYSGGTAFSEASVKKLETASTSSSPGDSKAWTKYGNSTYAASVHYMTNEDFNLITKQINKGDTSYKIYDYVKDNNSCYRKSFSIPCGYNNDMIATGSEYWLASAYNYDYLYEVSSSGVVSHSSGSRGVRPIVVLKSGVRFASGKGTSNEPYELTYNEKLESLNVSPSKFTLAINEERKLNVVKYPDVAKEKLDLEYTANDDKVSVSNDGIVSGVKTGKTSVTAKDKTTQKEITVEIEVINPTTPSLEQYFGKYVDYEPDDATWESSKLSSYGVSETYQNSQGKFDIYDQTTKASVKGKAKSQSITCKSSSGDYVSKYNGWRILDVSNKGQITLIHAGTPECYWHGSDSSASVKILETASTLSSPGDSKAWTKYGKATYAQSVHYMTNEDYNKITYQINKNNNYRISDNGGSNSTCYFTNNQGIRCGQDNELLDIGVYYWLASAYDSTKLYGVEPKGYVFGTSGSEGARPVVVLNEEIALGGGDGTESNPYGLARPKAKSLSASPASITVEVEKTKTINVIPNPTYAKVSLEYKADDNKISVNDKGVVTGNEEGQSSVTITDKLSGQSVVVEIQVVKSVTPSLSTHFGAYVNYTPTEATWDSSKLSSYGVVEYEASIQGYFNIYDKTTNASAKGKEKSQSITCYDSSYASKYNGWRVLDVSSSGQITLIHAGTPECYYHALGESAASVAVLETSSTSSSPGDSKAWTKYGNAIYAQSVHYMTNEDYNKITYQINKNNNYTIDDNGSSISTCYGSTNVAKCGRDNDMIDIGSYYYFASAYDYYDLYRWNPSDRYVFHYQNMSHGVRPVVVLKQGVKFADDGKDGSSEDNALNLVAT